MSDIYDTAEQIVAYYALPGNTVGGSLHIVLDDGNTEGHHVLWCLRHAEANGDLAGVKLAEAFIDLDRHERDRAIELAVGAMYRGKAIR